MLRKVAGATLVAAALVAAPVGRASAHDHDNAAAIGLGLLGAAAVVGTAAAMAGGQVYAAPPPVYVAPPPPVVYQAPPVVYEAPPAPVVYAQPYAYPYGYSYGYGYYRPHYWHRGWGEYHRHW